MGADNELLVEADMPYGRTGEGVHRFVDPVDGEVYVYANCGPDHAPAVFPCFDQPDLKGAFEVTVRAPEHWTVLSNGALRASGEGRWEFEPTARISTSLVTIAGGAFHSIGDEHDGIRLGLHCRRSLARYMEADAGEVFGITRRAFDRYHEVFEQRYAFGKYDQVFVPEMNWGAVEKPGCVLFNERFVFQSAVTDTQREVRAMVIAHEMAHMWFGNLVTMRWWDDLWLSESFAEYLGYEVAAVASRFTSPWTAFAVARKSWGHDADQRPTTHPVSTESLGDVAAALMNFDGIAYAKGASALRQLVAWVGEDAFFRGVNDYFAEHRFANADLGDLLDAIGKAAPGRDVREWARRWLRTTGVDTLTGVIGDTAAVQGDAAAAPGDGAVVPSDAVDAPGGAAAVTGDTAVAAAGARGVAGDGTAALGDATVVAGDATVAACEATAAAGETKAGVGGPAGVVGGATATSAGDAEGVRGTAAVAVAHGAAERPHRILVGLYDEVPGRGLVLRERRGVDLAPGVGSGATLLTGVERRPALLLPNDGDLTYAKVRLDEESWRAVTRGLSSIEDSLTRAVLWNTARDMVRDGDLPAVDYLALVGAQLPGEDEVAIAEGVLTFARRHVADRFVPPGYRAQALGVLTDVCRALLRRPDASADLRLAAVRTLIPSAHAADELDDLREWLRRGLVPGGPELDVELRWQILHQLAALGEGGESEIAAELARDPGWIGKEGAARCRAALPDPASKERAWTLLFAEDGPSPHLLAAVAQGFWQPARPETTAPYLARYFEEVPAASRRSQVVAMTLGRELFPVHAATQDIAGRAARCLERDDLAVALRRTLADQLDDLQRALRLRETHP
ncbi:M1 family aminopeptidase [Spirillospora sp. NPDC047279]|uniref:M1 family aminopeptidase n=1 Tax=Spirillospora sp. NPDC047279 TaxID=3155478 RepID=UPI0033E439D8